jgi:hypothetical protein
MGHVSRSREVSLEKSKTCRPRTAGLALAGDMHRFAIKFRLFAAGRWPLGMVGDTFRLF